MNMKRNTEAAIRKGAEIDAERESLPGDIHDRLLEQRNCQGWSVNIAAQQLGKTEATYRRYEELRDKPIPHDVIIRAAEIYHVSTDYLLGLTDIKFPTADLVTHIGLTEQSMNVLSSMDKWHDTINRIVCWKDFKSMIITLHLFAHGNVSKLIQFNNNMMAIGINIVNEQQKMGIGNAQENQKFLDLLSSQFHPHPDDSDLRTIESRARNMALQLRKDIERDGLSAPTLTPGEFHSIQQDLLDRKQHGEKVSFLDAFKNALTTMFLFVPFLKWRSTEVENEIILELPKSASNLVYSVERITRRTS